jgi:hypothetical protein
MAESQHFYTPVVGRFVAHSLTEKRSRDHENKPIAPEDQQYQINVAFPKAEIWQWLTTEFYGKVLESIGNHTDARNRVAAWFQNGFQGFSMKIYDGDKPSQRGTVNENTKGCLVFSFTSKDVPQCVAGPAKTPVDAEVIKRGYYVQVAGSLKFNEKTGAQMGIYMNMNIVWLVAEGDAIVGSVDPETAFGGAPAAPALPPGARPLGAASGAAAAFGAPAPQPQQYAAPAPQPQQYAAPAPQPQQYAPPPNAALVGAPMVAAPMPGTGFAPPPATAPQMTASPISGAPPAVAPYTGAMQFPLPPGAQ